MGEGFIEQSNSAVVLEDERNQRRWKTLLDAVYESYIEEVFQIFNEAKIQTILIKGWAIGRVYSSSKIRASGDVDVCVAPSDYEKAKLILKNNRFQCGVDLHKGLRHLDSLPFENLFKHSLVVPVNGVEVRILRPEDHLRVLCVHWLTDSGANRDRLWDVYYAVENRPSDFDWDRCLNAVSRTRRRWIVCTIALAHHHLGLNVDDTPVADEIKNPNLIPKWLTEAIEKEWREQIPLVPLAACWSDWTRMKQQIKKRFPPNPVQASIETEAPFNNFPRLPFQIVNFFQRLAPSIKQNFNLYGHGRLD